MKLTYFVSPYDLLDRKTKSAVSLTIDIVKEKNLGYSGIICIESSDRNHKLQTQCLITVSKASDGTELPQISALSNLNSSALPACFVLKLPKSIPFSLEILRSISKVTGIDLIQNQEPRATSMISLIAMNILSEKERSKYQQDSCRNACFYVKLPDQEHSYHVQPSPQMQGLSVSSIPFTHPTHVPQILQLLRGQVLFNVVIGSCIRKLSSFGSISDSKFSFEVMIGSSSSGQTDHISVSFEHPAEESLASLEIDLRDITGVKCKLYNVKSFENLCSDEYVSKIMQRSLSIPITLRMMILKTQEKARILREQEIKAAAAAAAAANNDLLNGTSCGAGSEQDQLDYQSFIANFNQRSHNHPVNQHNLMMILQKQQQSAAMNSNNPNSSILFQNLQNNPMVLSANDAKQRQATAAATAAMIQQQQQQMIHMQQNQNRSQSVQNQQLQPSPSQNSTAASVMQQQKQNCMLLNMVSPNDS